jgi:hypothetical protein
VEAEAVPQRVEEKTADIDQADLVVAILAEFEPDVVAKISDSLATLPDPLKIAVLENERRENPSGTRSEAPESNSSPKASVFHVPWPMTKPESTPTGAISLYATYQSVFAAANKLQARGCCIMASKLEAFTPRCICQFAQPLLDDQVDLVLPHYARRKFEGLLNNSILAPLTRTLYGKRVNNPMGPDFGLSQRLLQKVAANSGSASGRLHPLASLTPAALCQNLNILEVHLSSRIYPQTDWANMSSILADVLSPVFLDMERNAACWQRTRFSTPLPTAGEPYVGSQDTSTLDTTRLVESFQLGNRELQEIWGLVLPPSTLVELRKLSRLPGDKFQMPDELWVRIVYDFALAHRLRTISRDHLLRSMTPLYLGWVASYAHDVRDANGFFVERRLERLSAVYEAGKPYLVSRWRWPDRFNP